MLAVTLMALAPAQAQSTVEDRIDATFALFEDAPVLTVPLGPNSRLNSKCRPKIGPCCQKPM